VLDEKGNPLPPGQTGTLVVAAYPPPPPPRPASRKSKTPPKPPPAYKGKPLGYLPAIPYEITQN